jgi:hypothetical protein
MITKADATQTAIDAVQRTKEVLLVSANKDLIPAPSKDLPDSIATSLDRSNCCD